MLYFPFIKILFIFLSVSSYLCATISEKVLICGVCRDVETFLPDTIKIIENIGSFFKEYHVIIYENNSIDSTKSILRQWMHSNSQVEVYCEDIPIVDLKKSMKNLDENGNFFKTELIAFARNKLLDFIFLPNYNSYSYVIMIDMDFKTSPSKESIEEVFNMNMDWDAVFAYGVSSFNTYWDWYAFRDINYPLGPELLGQDWFCQKRWSLGKNDQWGPVYSAFGGMGIYKKNSIKGCRYSGVVTNDMEKVYLTIINKWKEYKHPVICKYLKEAGMLSSKNQICSKNLNSLILPDENIRVLIESEHQSTLVWKMHSDVFQYPVVCEHVPFHASMILNGHGKLFINPRMIFTYTR